MKEKGTEGGWEGRTCGQVTVPLWAQVSSSAEIHRHRSMLNKCYFHSILLCASLCIPGRITPTSMYHTGLHHPLNMPLNNPAKREFGQQLRMYVCVCTSQTRSAVSSRPGSNGRWYFKESTKPVESSESYYECEPAQEASPERCLLPHCSPWPLFITLFPGLFSFTSSEFSLLHLSQLNGICCNDAAVTH